MGKCFKIFLLSQPRFSFADDAAEGLDVVESQSLSDEETAQLEERLRSLGYL